MSLILVNVSDVRTDFIGFCANKRKRILQEGSGYPLSPTEMSDADERVEVFYLFTAYLARPTLVKKRDWSQGHAVFSFMRI
jgi:hypothetical protein